MLRLGSFPLLALALLLLLLLLPDGAEAAKRRRGAKKAKSLFGLPGQDQAELCEGCMATVIELDKMVDAQAKRLGRENAVTEAFESICTFESYKVYKFSPPKMVKACKAILDVVETPLEEMLVAGATVEEMQRSICTDRGACDGIDLDQIEPGQPDIQVSGGGPDAKTTMHVKDDL